jgi:glutamate 5-kinase
MKEVNKLFIGKYSSSLIAHETTTGRYEIDTACIDSHGRQINKLTAQGWGAIVITAFARNRLGAQAASRVIDTWQAAIDRDTQAFLVTEAEMDVAGGLDHILDFATSGGVAIVNGNHALLGTDSKYQNNDYSLGALAKQAATSGLFDEGIQARMFSNVGGILADVNDASSVVSVIEDVAAYRHLVVDTHDAGTTGGAITKLDVGEVCQEYGVELVIAHGRTENIVALTMAGLAGTRFV